MAKAKQVPQVQTKLQRVLPWLLIIGGIIGIICSLILTYDQIRVWQNPSYHPACSLNPILSCGNVIDSKQGHIFGIPGPFYGLLAFPVLVTIGVAMLAGARFKRWFWLGLQAGALGGIVYALWLFWLSLFKVHALCPFCLLTDVVVYTTVWYITLYNLEQGTIKLPKSWAKMGNFARRHHLDILLFWFLLLIVFILHHFWYYFDKHLPF
jgi:uncharacterized membrane protein